MLRPKDRKLRDGHGPERPCQMDQCPCVYVNSRSQPSGLILQVEGEAKLCPSMPTCSGDAQSTARPLTTLRSARRTSRCSSWKYGAFKTPSPRVETSPCRVTHGDGDPSPLWPLPRPACCGVCRQRRRHLRSPASPSHQQLWWRGERTVLGTGLWALSLGSSEVLSCSLDPAGSTQSVPE